MNALDRWFHMSGIDDGYQKEEGQGFKLEGQNLIIVGVLVAAFVVITILMFMILPMLLAEIPPPYYP
jgi:hypothetical protein